MGHHQFIGPTEDIPEVFCWTKYGNESGEHADAILARKEAERQANQGLFLWGIGNAIGPSVGSLLELTCQPRVVFTPMLSRASAKDVAPAQVAIWLGGLGLDGAPYEVPVHSRVTSRYNPTTRSHYALVCTRDVPLQIGGANSPAFAACHVQNLRSGSKVGASQVTSVVRRIACALGSLPSSYRVAFTADLAPPYLVRLTDCTLLNRVVGLPTAR